MIFIGIQYISLTTIGEHVVEIDGGRPVLCRLRFGRLHLVDRLPGACHQSLVGVPHRFVLRRADLLVAPVAVHRPAFPVVRQHHVEDRLEFRPQSGG